MLAILSDQEKKSLLVDNNYYANATHSVKLSDGVYSENSEFRFKCKLLVYRMTRGKVGKKLFQKDSLPVCTYDLKLSLVKTDVYIDSLAFGMDIPSRSLPHKIYFLAYLLLELVGV